MSISLENLDSCVSSTFRKLLTFIVHSSTELIAHTYLYREDSDTYWRRYEAHVTLSIQISK